MNVYLLPNGRHLAKPLREAGLRLSRLALRRFPNGERQVVLGASPASKRCVLVGPLTADPRDLVAMTMAAHTLRKEGAARANAVMPYLSYLRHDHDEPRKSRGVAWLGGLLAASGVNDVVTVDAHSELAVRALGIPATSVDPAPLFADALRELPPDVVFIAPDDGAIVRANALARALGREERTGYFEKTRTADGIVLGAFHGTAAPSAVLVDDILDTGATLLAAARRLRESGTRDITVVVSHGLFTGTAWRALWDFGVRRILTTDTLPLPARAEDDRIRTISVVRSLVPHMKP